jgi:hypothetical protein
MLRGCGRETGEFAVDAVVFLGRVLGRGLDDESPEVGSGRWSSWFWGWLGPVFGDVASVSSKQGVGG